MSATESSRLFNPVSLGGKPIHRVALAPLTRLRNTFGEQTPRDHLAPKYYEQRGSKGTLLITEATFIAREAGGYPRAPGIYNAEQIARWKKVTNAVHANGGLIYVQLWALGRGNNDPPLHEHMDDVKTVSASPIGVKGRDYPPEEMSLDDIARYISHYRQAALNAVEAGFDGVEVHCANGYLPDQFLQSVSNKRTDAYGGSLEKRAKFGLEAVAACVEAIGQERVGVRYSPWGTFQDMGEEDPFVPFTYVTKEIVQSYPKLSYVHFVEPREWYPGSADESHLKAGVKPSNDPFRAIVRGLDPASVNDQTVFPDPSPERPTVFISASGYTPEIAVDVAERTGDVIAFGRHFISNPDLPERIRKGVPLTHYNRETFYAHEAEGYTDYPFAGEEISAQA